MGAQGARATTGDPLRRIVVFTWMDPENPRGGGDVKFLEEMCMRLVRDGSEVTWVASRLPGAPTESIYHGIRLLRVGNLYTVFAAHHVSRRVRERLPGALVLETISSVPYLIRDTDGRRQISIIQHIIPFSQMAGKIGALAPVAYVTERVIAPALYRDRTLLVPSRATESEVRHLGYRNVRRFTLGTDLIGFDPGVKERLVVAPGPVKPWKHHDDIIRAFQRTDPSWKLAIYGSWETPGYARSLRGTIAECGLTERAFLLGRITDAEKVDLLRRASVCMVASEKEGWGLAAMEAQSAGCPVIGYDVLGLNEAVESGRTALLVTPGRWAELGGALDRLIHDDALLRQMAVSSAARSQAFGWESCYRQFRTLLEQPEPPPVVQAA
jgi:glycosyltransferase involved in cell wall biosynthesis